MGRVYMLIKGPEKALPHFKEAVRIVRANTSGKIPAQLFYAGKLSCSVLC